ncbi:MAG: hypothetical protein M1825_001036 [Sarcosagium campestre]|nr:MAG: hypothetical protein M1825_001036 [Sarcosagium campestre]
MPPTSPWNKDAKHNFNPQDGFPGLAAPALVAEKNTSKSEEYKSRQDDEVEALRSIYMTDFKEVVIGPGAWNKSADHAFKLHLTAYSDPETSVVLSVTMTATYPSTVPVLVLSETDQLPSSYQKKVQDIVTMLPKTLVGSEMIFDIATPIRDILEDAVQAKAAGLNVPSLEEERAIQEAEAQKEDEMRAAELERETVEADLEEERMLEQMVEEEMQRQREKLRDNRRRSKRIDNHPNLGQLSSEADSDSVAFDQTSTVKTEECPPVSFNAVCGMVRLSRGPVTDVYLSRPAGLRDASHSISLVIKRVNVVDSPAQEPDFKARVLDLERELEVLKQLRKASHANVLDILDFKVNRVVKEESGSWEICVLTEYANKGSLGDMLDLIGTVRLESVRAWTIQLLEALEFFHCSGIVHRAIHLGNILLSRTRPGNIVIKLSDAGYQKRVHELCESGAASAVYSSSRSTYWTAPELTEAGSNKHTRKTDVWDFGVVFLQMVFGTDVLEKHTSADSLLNTMDLTAASETFIQKLFKSDPKKRPNAFDLLASEFLRTNGPLLEQGPQAEEGLISPPISSGNQRPFNFRNPSISEAPVFSRYATEFHEINRLGKGGFGEVFKARNKLDGQLYAVKKISLKSAGLLSDVLSETMLLSRLNHPYVVRYFNTWPEEDAMGMSETDEDAISITDESSFSQSNALSVDFGQSTGGLDFISSTGPDIQFGYDSDEDGSDSAGEAYVMSSHNASKAKGSDALGSGAELALKRTQSSQRVQRQVRTTLYIQMEYCKKHTLRDTIRQGLCDHVDEGWRLFRQIVEGLNHIHEQGIIHRDLKPDNIFIDVASNPRIGDFGLATSGKYYLADMSSDFAGNTDGDLTRSIGTALYVAPELRSNVNGHYNEKVDMYSLGIIFFEMCLPLKTAMERDAVVRALREKNHALPAEFSKPEKAIQGDIITSLVNHRPSERPSTTELLRGGKLPMQIEDETIRQALRGLADSKSPHYRKMMSALFSQPTEAAKDYAWDLGFTASYGPNELLLQGIVKETLISIFRRHGAVETTRPLLFPRSNLYAGNVAQLLDTSGTLLQLPYDLTLPYARSIAKKAPAAQKSFAFGSVYRDLFTGGQPRSHGEVDFDIVSFDTLDLALKEAEVLKVIDEIIDAFPPLQAAEMVFHLNHSALLDLIMEFCRIPAPKRPAVKDIISKLNIGQWTWQKIRNELRSPSLGVWSTSLDDLECFDFRDVPQKAFEKLRQLFHGTEYIDKTAAIFAHLNTVATYASQFNVQRNIFVSPLSSFNDKFYRGGILFQCLYDSKRRDVFAAGGRYDQLIQDHRPKKQTDSQTCHAVGLNLGWEKLFTSMVRYQKSSSKSFLKKQPDEELKAQWSPRRSDVLVASFDAKVLRSIGLSLLRQLWAYDISAELAVDARSPDELLSHYRDDRHSWIVIIKQDAGSHGDHVLKVKSMIRKDESEIRSTELVSWLRSEIRERDQRDGISKERSKVPRKSITHETSGASSSGNAGQTESEADVRVLFALQKGKKYNRRSVIDAGQASSFSSFTLYAYVIAVLNLTTDSIITAQTRAKELTQSMLSGPVAAVGIKDDILYAIRDAPLVDTDAWRRIIQSAPPTERKYIEHVRDLLVDLAKEKRNVGTRNAFVYNFRTGACIYYDLGKPDSNIIKV